MTEPALSSIWKKCAGRSDSVFFGSALTNFGVEIFPHFLQMTTTPLPRKSDVGVVEPVENNFSAFVFKIQANMNKGPQRQNCFHAYLFREVRSEHGGQACAGEEKSCAFPSRSRSWPANEPYWMKPRGGLSECLIPVFSPIGDTLCMPKGRVCLRRNPYLAPEHFAEVRQVDTMKRKQFELELPRLPRKSYPDLPGIQCTGMEEIIVGVVGVLQFDVLKYRLNNEYNVETVWSPFLMNISAG